MVAPQVKSERGQFLITRNDAPITILLVDDDPDCRMLIRDAISGCKVSNDVHEVCNGLEALQFLRKQGPFASAPRPGLIYMDIEMPGMDGLETLRQIKADPRLHKMPVIMLTTTEDPREVDRCHELGCNVYIHKPVAFESFQNAIAQLGKFVSLVKVPPLKRVS